MRLIGCDWMRSDAIGCDWMDAIGGDLVIGCDSDVIGWIGCD
jgi:hypothetical protein